MERLVTVNQTTVPRPKQLTRKPLEHYYIFTVKHVRLSSDGFGEKDGTRGAGVRDACRDVGVCGKHGIPGFMENTGLRRQVQNTALNIH